MIVSALLVLVGAWTPASPANAALRQADPGHLTGECRWDEFAAAWVIDWRLQFPDESEPYRLTQVDSVPADAELTGLAADPPTEYPHDPADPLLGQQRVDADAETAGLTLTAEWADARTRTATGQVTIPGDCEAPALPDLIREVGFDCQYLRVTIENPTQEPIRLTVVPSGSTPTEVEVAAEGSATVAVPAGEGRSVDIRLDGRSIVDPDRPITITSAEWAALECDADGGQAADLPATGSRVLLLVGGAVLLVMLGAGLFLVARRRGLPGNLA